MTEPHVPIEETQEEFLAKLAAHQRGERVSEVSEETGDIDPATFHGAWYAQHLEHLDNLGRMEP